MHLIAFLSHRFSRCNHFRLPAPYPVTRKTRISFSFTVERMAQGHAICLDNDDNEDTFGGTRIRCLMLAGKQFALWNHVKKINLVDLKDGIARQSSSLSSGYGQASKAVDGNVDQYWNYVSSLNSVSQTQRQIEPWWEFEFTDDVNGNNEFDIAEIIFYAGIDCVGCEDLIKFTVTVDDGTNDISYGETVSPNGIVHVNVNRSGSRVRIALDGPDQRILSLAEVQIIGTLAEGDTEVIDVNVKELFPAGEDTMIKYIAFIQDDDSNPYPGDPRYEDGVMSMFQDIRLYESNEDDADQLVSNVCISIQFSNRCFPFYISNDCMLYS